MSGRRRLAGAAVAVLHVAGIVACTPNRPSAAVQWLSARDGVIEAEIAADHSDAFSSSGIIRGELDADLSADEADRNLELTSYDVEPAELLGQVSSSPVAATLPSISLVGSQQISAVGTLDQLQGFIADTTALLALDDEFVGIDLAADSVRITLYSPVGTDPDMTAVAAALRASSIWTTHAVVIHYLNYDVYIVDGIASLGSEDYAGAEMMAGLVAAWNAP